MSESERWVPVEMVRKTVFYGDWEEPPLSVGLTIPPIPADVFAAMVERGARAWCRAIDANPDEMGYSAAYEGEHPLWQTFIPEATACLRAALGISDE